MVRDLWEFMNREVRARVIFGAVITGVILLIAVPYFANVLTKKSNSEVTTAADTRAEEATNTAKTETAGTTTQTTPAPAEPEPTASEPAEATAPAETTDTYAYRQSTTSKAKPATNASTATTPAASQPVASTAAATETTSQNTTPKVDDRMSSSRDDGYTASGIDNPGANEAAWGDEK